MRVCPIGAIVMRDEINEIIAQLKLHVKDYRKRARFNKSKRGWYGAQISKSQVLIRKFERLKKTYDWKHYDLRTRGYD